ncbi:MAG: GvpL/GvpF family gas vesicle protein [Nitrospirae bacterium]|nr:GvpL/GvpF family gas vesicle protein [Nitrospirota bacterium]
MSTEEKYIYCIVATGNEEKFGPFGIGGRGDELYTITYQDTGALVSNTPILNYKVNRENLLCHERAIEEVMKYHTVLPVRFGTVAEDEKQVKRILEKEYIRFRQLLDEMGGKKELGLKVVFKEEAIYKDILTNYNEIRIRKEMIANEPPEKTYHQRMEIGKMVEVALEKEKKKYRENILHTLMPLCKDVRINNTYGERMIVNAAFLVNKHREAEFDIRVNELSDKYVDLVKFKYVGTLPPFNFVNLIINVGEY